VVVAGGLGAGDIAGRRDDEGKVKPNIATADATQHLPDLEQCQVLP
jgi:hypothetical protein